MPTRFKQLRNERGSFTVLGLIFFMVILALGLFGYEATLARQQFNELQAATDASALAGATYLGKSPTPTLGEVNTVALAYFGKNRLLTGDLAAATLSPTTAQDSGLATGASHFNAIINPDESVTTQAAFGLKPVLLSFLGPYTIYATSTAGRPITTFSGDVAIVLDLSASLAFITSGTNQVRVQFAVKGKKNPNGANPGNPRYVQISHSAPLSGNVSNGPYLAKGYAGLNAKIPDPAIIGFAPDPPVPNYTPVQPVTNGSKPNLSIDPTNTPLLYATLNSWAQRFQPGANPAPPVDYRVTIKVPETGAGARPYFGSFSLTQDDKYNYPANWENGIDYAKTALLIAAKAKVLDRVTLPEDFKQLEKSIVASFNVVNTDEKKSYVAEYNKLALPCVQSLAAEKRVIQKIIQALDGVGVKWSLIGYNNAAASETNGKESFFDALYPEEFQHVLVGLDRNIESGAYNFVANDTSHAKAVLKALELSTVKLGTNTPDGLKKGYEQLKNSTSPAGVKKTIILLTDGCPTSGGSVDFVKKTINKDFNNRVKVIVCGFFPKYARPKGPNFCKKLAKVAGAGGFGSPKVAFVQTPDLPKNNPSAAEFAENNQVADVLAQSVIEAIQKNVGAPVSLR